jgi:hypothetical protein
MRTTITIADDVFAEMERLRAEQGLGPSEALNLLARRGMAMPARRRADYVHHGSPMGLQVDVSDIGAVLDLLDQLDEQPAAQ